MSKSEPRDREEEVEKEVLERLPRWRRELLRMRDRAQAEARDKSQGREEKG